jgi:iron complex transport system substrate-binding protein
LASQKFDSIEAQYNHLLEVSATVEQKPRVLSSLPWKDTWYVPGGRSYFARLIKDAGGDYIWKENKSHESIPLAIEEVIAKGSDADIWINTGTAKYKVDILGKDERLKSIQAYQNNKVYNNNARQNSAGGNAFWETGIVKPHVLLKDLIEIFHPELLNHDLYYYQNLKNK